MCLRKDMPVTYPVLQNIAKKFLTAFPSSYLVVNGFSTVVTLLKKIRPKDSIDRQNKMNCYLKKDKLYVQ